MSSVFIKIFPVTKIAVIAIIGRPDSGATKGVHDKVCAQVSALNANGYDAHGFFGLTERSSNKLGSPSTTYFLMEGRLAKFSRKHNFFRSLIPELVNFMPDIIYIRYPLSGHSLLIFLRQLRKKIPGAILAFERQTIEPVELLIQKSFLAKIKYLLELIYRKPVQKLIDANIGVTNEICEYVRSYYPANHCIVCGNGIDSSFANEANFNKIERDLDEICLVFVGNISPWNGLEPLIDYLRKIQFQHNGKRIILDVIGDGTHLGHLRDRYSADVGHVTFHGFLEGDDLKSRISVADIAIGALNNDLRGLAEGSNLKLRLYCSLGIPFVLGEHDSDFMEDVNTKGFYFRIEPESMTDALTFDAMLKFAENVKTDSSLKRRMIQHALTKLTWDVKMPYIMEKIQKL
jgi:glycosyltransferase involved in cell wall biosynthesis